MASAAPRLLSATAWRPMPIAGRSGSSRRSAASSIASASEGRPTLEATAAALTRCEACVGSSSWARTSAASAAPGRPMVIAPPAASCARVASL